MTDLQHEGGKTDPAEGDKLQQKTKGLVRHQVGAETTGKALTG